MCFAVAGWDGCPVSLLKAAEEVALPEDPSETPSTHMMAHTSLKLQLPGIPNLFLTFTSKTFRSTHTPKIK